jgi:hypothetical protein
MCRCSWSTASLVGQSTLQGILDGIGLGVGAIEENERKVQNPAYTAIGIERSAILAILTGGKFDPTKFKPLKKIIKEAIQEWVNDNKKRINEEFTNSICSSIVGALYFYKI